MKAMLAPPAAPPTSSPPTSPSPSVAVLPKKNLFRDLNIIFTEIIKRKIEESNIFTRQIRELIFNADTKGKGSGKVKISTDSRNSFTVKVKNTVFFGEQQTAWDALIKLLEAEFDPHAANNFYSDFVNNLTALATYNVKTPESVLVFLFLRINTYADELEQIMAAKCLGIPIHIYWNNVKVQGLPFRLEPICDSSPHSLNILYDFHGATSLLNHFSPVFITEKGNNDPNVVPVETLVELGLVENSEDGQKKRTKFLRSRSHSISLAPLLVSQSAIAAPSTPFPTMDFSAILPPGSNSLMETASLAVAAWLSADFPALSSTQSPFDTSSLALPPPQHLALPPPRQSKLPTAADLFGGANANELQSEGASGDSTAEKEADKPSNDAVAMYKLAKGDLYLANFVHPKGDVMMKEVTYQVEGITNFNVHWYQGTRK
jgi:hypothetical protein